MLKRVLKSLLDRLGLVTPGRFEHLLGRPSADYRALEAGAGGAAFARFAELSRFLNRFAFDLAAGGGGRGGADPDPRLALARALLGGALRQLSDGLSVDEKLELTRALAEVRPLDCADYPILLHVDSRTEAHLRSISCFKEAMTVRWLQEELRPGDVLYDIGANVGAYALVAAKAAGGGAKVYAFEPSFLNFHQLCRNILLNGCEDSIIPLLVPLCGTSRLDRFYYQNMETGGAFHAFARPVDYKAEAFRPAAALGTLGFALDDLASIPGVEPPSLVKLDVDGLEHEVLRGGRRVLRHPGLRGLLVEINEGTPGEAGQILAAAHDAGLVPREKHQLHQGIHNYVLVRAADGAAPRAPSDVPTTWSREGRPVPAAPRAAA